MLTHTCGCACTRVHTLTPPYTRKQKKSVWRQAFSWHSVPEGKRAESSKLCEKEEAKNIAPSEVVQIYREHGKVRENSTQESFSEVRLKLPRIEI